MYKCVFYSSIQAYLQTDERSVSFQMTNCSLRILFSISLFRLSYSIVNDTVFCPDIEKLSLLSFKQSLKDPNNLLSSWDSIANCCDWNGVICSNSTGSVHELSIRGLSGKINSSLLNLKHLRYLDLSQNSFSGESIPNFIGSLENLEYLNLSRSGFRGKVPETLGNLSKLHALDLEGYPDFLVADSLEWLLKLSQLEFLNMDFVNLSRANNWAQVINSLPSLVELHFHFCSLDFRTPLDHVNTTSLKHLSLSDNFHPPITVPLWFFQLSSLLSLNLRGNHLIGPIPSVSNATKLHYIDLSSNDFDSSIPDWFYLCKDLEFVDFASNHLNGTVSKSIANITSLKNLRLESNQFSGKIPKEIANLCHIQRLDFSDNTFLGEISDSFGNMSECFLESLEYLRLRDNALSGHLTNRFGEFKSLRYLNLGLNSLSGVIPMNIGNLSSLETIYLQGNKFTGILPESLGQLSNLQLLYMNDNMLEGVVTEIHFANLTKLDSLFASGNHLTLEVGSDWNPPFQLSTLQIASWNLGVGSPIPSWLEKQRSIVDLDLADTGISGNIPDWIWKMEILTLSHNRLHGDIPYLVGKERQYIYLGSNLFNGSLPRIGDNVIHLDLSNNLFSGGVSHILCDPMNVTYRLELLHLGGNQLSGELPECWMKWPSLKYVNIGNNKMTGRIPNSIGYLAELESLNFYGNIFSGEMPYSMHNCTELVKMDLADNDLDGDIPAWVGSDLVKLTFLILRSNKLTGKIPSEICHLSSLQILDLSGNKLSGIIPRCLNNLSGMATERSLGRYRYSYSFYWWNFIESVSVAIKGNEYQYGTTLSLVTNINFAKNNLSGEIPKELTSLVELRSLNFSQNHLTGLIPENIGDMKKLESLDLSTNSLSGQIPNSFTLLSSLNHLNLSHNNLSGRIPRSTQLQSLDASSFSGNNLCGPPLIVNCSNDGEDDGRDNEEVGDESKIEWFYVLLSLGYAVGLSAICSALLWKKPWREAYFKFLERMYDKLYVYVCIRWTRLTNSSHQSS